MLSDQLLQSLLPTDKPVKKSDGGGLHIYAMPLGRKRWRLAYRFDGKQKTIDGGEYPTVSLHRARVWREEMKSLLANGIDPIDQRKEAKFQAIADKVTFSMLAREWIEARRPAWSPRYARLIEGRLENDILPIIGEKPVRTILPRTMLEALRVIEARGSFEMAHRIKNHCSEIFRFGIPDGRCESDPCRDLSAAMISQRRPSSREG